MRCARPASTAGPRSPSPARAPSSSGCATAGCTTRPARSSSSRWFPFRPTRTPGFSLSRRLQEDTPMNILEQIDALETRKQNARSRMDQILDHARDEDRTCTPEESTEYDAVAAECKRLDDDLARWREREVVNKSLATVAGSPPPTPEPPRPRAGRLRAGADDYRQVEPAAGLALRPHGDGPDVRPGRSPAVAGVCQAVPGHARGRGRHQGGRAAAP